MRLLKKLAIIGVVAWFATGTLVNADDGQELLKGKDCVGCHKLDAKAVGPSYKQIAEKYKGDANAKEALVKKVKTGGAGNWGQIPMPPHPKLEEEEIGKIIDWVLTQ